MLLPYEILARSLARDAHLCDGTLSTSVENQFPSRRDTPGFLNPLQNVNRNPN
jgi:hypothetical protein